MTSGRKPPWIAVETANISDRQGFWQIRKLRWAFLSSSSMSPTSRQLKAEREACASLELRTLMDPLMNQQYPLQIWAGTTEQNPVEAFPKCCTAPSEDTAGQEKFQSVTTQRAPKLTSVSICRFKMFRCPLTACCSFLGQRTWGGLAFCARDIGPLKVV